ncbi:antibiotic biosynthesis monooxygenase family protein [Corynebacterium guangdongense]|nr:antibiotic biosynthesis monooxygenase [Corynebacterium guangdongense]WJZ17763.1 Heme-degrading monooxygenase HmoB [Corynebacterium guangdongense]
MSFCKITSIAVPAPARAEFERSFAFRRGFVDIVDGFEGLQLLRPLSEGSPYQLLTFWRDEASHRAWRQANPRQDDESTKNYDVANYEVIQRVEPVRE